MKRLLLLAAILMMAFSMAWAQSRYVTDISYYDDSGAHTIYYTQIPSTTVTELGVRYTAVYPITQLQAANFYLYGIVGTPTGAIVKIYNVDTNGFPTGFPLGVVNVPRANLTTGGWNTVDLTSLNLSFAQNAKFVITVSVDGGTVGTAALQFFLNRIASTEFPSHSVRLISGAWAAYQGVTLGGVANSGGEYFISATVNYNAPYHDVAASSIWFTGQVFLQQNQTVTYEADITNVGDQVETNIPVTIEIADATYPSRTILFTDTQYVATMNPTDVAHVNTFAGYTFANPGEYIVTLRTGLVGDMDATNNELYLEQQVVVLPTTLTYDDGSNEGAWAPNVAGNYFANEFTCPIGPVHVQQIHFYVYGSTWPSPGSTTMGIAVFDNDGLDGDGNPGAPGTQLYYAEVPVTRGAWNTFDITNSHVIVGDGHFFVAYKSLADYPNCPGMGVDNNTPYTAWKVSWETSGGSWYQVYPEYEMDWMIRATVDYIEFWTPEDLTITQLGPDIILDWTDVPATNYYEVYQGDAPDHITNRIGTDITDSTFLHAGGALDGKSFYKVTASTMEMRTATGRESVARKLAGRTTGPKAVLAAE